MEWGPRVKTLIADEKKHQRPNPTLATRPTLRMDTKFYWSHFFLLTDARQYNQAGVQPMTTEEIIQYIDFIGVKRGDPAFKFFRVMREMDTTYLNWWAKKNQPKPDKKGKK